MQMMPATTLKEGMILAEDVVSQGIVVVTKDTKLTRTEIQKILNFKVMVVNIYEDEDLAATFYESVRKSKKYAQFCDNYNAQLIAYRAAVDSFIYNHVTFSRLDLLKIVDSLVPEDMTGKTLFAYLYNMLPSEETMTYAHGLNVGLICRIFSRWLNFDLDDQEALTMAGMIYDVGKCLLPHDIIWKPGKLNDLEFGLMQTHAFHAYHLLSKTSIDPRILDATLQHHERNDGSGYPQGLKADQIAPFAKIIAIVDMYEAMTTARSYRQPMCAYKVMSIFEQEFFQKYDFTYMQTFCRHIADELIGVRVKLSNDIEGTVIMNSPNSFSRPIIQLDDGNIVDLSKNRTENIIAII